MQDLDYEIEEVALELNSEELVKEVTPLIKEYFEHGDSNEVLVRFIFITFLFLQAYLYIIYIDDFSFSLIRISQ